MRVFRSVAVLPFLSIFASPVAAQDDDAVVVTATRVPKRFNELVNDVTVIRRAELERAGQGSLASVLDRKSVV